MYRDVVEYKDIGHDNGNCSFSSVLPAKNLIFLESENGDTEALKRRIFEAAVGDPELLTVDAFVCQYVASLLFYKGNSTFFSCHDGLRLHDVHTICPLRYVQRKGIAQPLFLNH